MVSDALKSAQACLAIQTVHLSHCYGNVRADFDPARCDRESLLSQGFHALQSADALEFEGENAQGYRFTYLCGFRLVGKDEDQAAEGYVPNFEIVGSFSASYRCSRQLSDEEVEAFSKNNVAYHIWPYWREYLQSTAARMGLKEGIEVPMYRIS